MLKYCNPVNGFFAFREAISIIKEHWFLTLEMTKRDLVDQYAGQIFGSVWVVIHPLFTMALYVFIFGVVFKTKIGGTVDLPLDYTTYILSGLIPWLSFQASMAKGCTALTSHSNLVKQVVFPIEVLPVKVAFSVMPTFILSFLVLVIYSLIKYKTLSICYLLLPGLIFFQILAMIGIAFILSAISVFFRDLKDLVLVFLTVGIYLMPIVYLPTWVPAIFRPILYVNFFSYMIWCYQDVLYFGRIEHPWAWVIFGIGSGLLFVFGYCLFRWLKPYFGNYL